MCSCWIGITAFMSVDQQAHYISSVGHNITRIQRVGWCCKYSIMSPSGTLLIFSLLPVLCPAVQFSECEKSSSRTVYDFKAKLIDDKTSVNIKDFSGSVLMIINVATYWGYTSQYLAMNAPIRRYGATNFYILAFPCNQFGLQEPGHNDEILKGLKYIRPGNCYQPEFHVMAKVDVNGPKEHPLFTYMKNKCPPTNTTIGDPAKLYWQPLKTNDISWNFEKFLIGRDGQPRYRFHPSTEIKEILPFIDELVKEARPAQFSQPSDLQNLIQNGLYPLTGQSNSNVKCDD